MKKVFAVKGLGRTGKSTIINNIYQNLKKIYPDYEIIEEKGRKDIKAILIINGIKVCIECQGDPSSRQPKSLEYFVKEACDIIVVASRTRRKTYEAIRDIKKDGYDTLWFETTKQSDIPNQQKENRKIKNEILNAINKLLIF